jgi:hypothetical protein
MFLAFACSSFVFGFTLHCRSSRRVASDHKDDRRARAEFNQMQRTAAGSPQSLNNMNDITLLLLYEGEKTHRGFLSLIVWLVRSVTLTSA